MVLGRKRRSALYNYGVIRIRSTSICLQPIRCRYTDKLPLRSTQAPNFSAAEPNCDFNIFMSQSLLATIPRCLPVPRPLGTSLFSL